jgi:MYXO-CTERM domain-containing protein
MAIAGVLALGLSEQAARAQATSSCYYNMGRMVDAQPLAGQKRSTDQLTSGLHYLLYLPIGHDPAKKWPVIVFMHGSGEINAAGDTLNILTKHSLPRIVEDPKWNWPFIVISPQIDNAGWLSHAAQITATLDYVEQQYGGDRNREYLTGLSYGGIGTLAVGIALADRVAALVPVTPGGGGLSNWTDRTKIANLPIWFTNGTIDAEYNINKTRSTDLEASGASTFFRYDYAFADEYKDVVPQQALNEKHIFGSYEMIGHDVWHATYGVYCPELDAQKTVLYQWLLKQSRDGSPFVDPRGPGALGDAGLPFSDSGMTESGAGGATSDAGGGAAGSGGVQATEAGGSQAGAPPASTGGSGGAAGGASGAAGSSMSSDGAPAEQGGCSCSTVRRGSTAGGVAALLAMAFAGVRRRRRVHGNLKTIR